VSGFDRFRGLTSEEKLVSDDWRQIGLGGTDDQFLWEMIDRYREMMFRTARAITRNDYDADDVIRAASINGESSIRILTGCGETFIPAACLSTFSGAAGVTSPNREGGEHYGDY
jgi:hypothetical protein